MKLDPGSRLIRPVAVLCAALLIPGEWSLWAFQENQPNGRLMPPEQLEDLVAPIALYADPLIAQILAASTYPLEIVEASRWMQANSNLRGAELADAAKDQSWDPSVQALVVFPSVVQMMDRNLKWTTDLGNAFLAQQEDVMDAIQRQRQRASDSGKLASNEQQSVERNVVDNRPVIVIQPVQPEMIYVPVYDPYWVWGRPRVVYYPDYWYPPRPVAGVVIAAGVFGFFIGVGMNNYYHHWGGWNNWGWRPGWGNRRVIVNNNFYVNNHYRPPPSYSGGRQEVWSHNPQHRVGVPYSSRDVANRVGAPAPRPAMRTERDRPVVTRPDARERSQPTREARPAPRQSSPSPSRDRTALGGIGDGSRTRVESDRGYSSLGNRGEHPGRSREARPAPNPQPAPAARQAPAPRPAPAARTSSERQTQRQPQKEGERKRQ
jgi:hypothetical protein